MDALRASSWVWADDGQASSPCSRRVPACRPRPRGPRSGIRRGIFRPLWSWFATALGRGRRARAERHHPRGVALDAERGPLAMAPRGHALSPSRGYCKRTACRKAPALCAAGRGCGPVPERLPLDPGGVRPAVLQDFTGPVPDTRLDRTPQVQPLDLRPWPRAPARRRAVSWT